MDESLVALTIIKVSFHNSLFQPERGLGPLYPIPEVNRVRDSTVSQPMECGQQLKKDVIENEVDLNTKALKKAHRLRTPTTSQQQQQPWIKYDGRKCSKVHRRQC